jgi:hypothetical protein
LEVEKFAKRTSRYLIFLFCILFVLFFYFFFFSPNAHLCLLPPFPNAGVAAISTSIPERWRMVLVVQEGGVSRPE